MLGLDQTLAFKQLHHLSCSLIDVHVEVWDTSIATARHASKRFYARTGENTTLSS
jgi:hypothetical protein